MTGRLLLRYSKSGLTDEIKLRRTKIAGFFQRMSGLGAEMRHVDDRCGVIRLDPQDLTGLQGLQTLARFQNGQGAQQPFGIKFGIKFHAPEVGPIFQLVHQLVTGSRVTFGTVLRKQGT